MRKRPARRIRRPTAERTAELALADAWLARVGDPVVEIGAVTPYCWPDRVAIDPAGRHEQVSVCGSLFDVDLKGCNVLSISSIEHVGDRYGPTERRSPLEAGGLDGVCDVGFLVRNPDEAWEADEREEARRPCGGPDRPWANSVCIVERGGMLAAPGHGLLGGRRHAVRRLPTGRASIPRRCSHHKPVLTF